MEGATRNLWGIWVVEGSLENGSSEGQDKRKLVRDIMRNGGFRSQLMKGGFRT